MLMMMTGNLVGVCDRDGWDEYMIEQLLGSVEGVRFMVGGVCDVVRGRTGDVRV